MSEATSIIVRVRVEAVNAQGEVVESADGRGVVATVSEESLAHLSALADAGITAMRDRAQGPWEGQATGKRRRMVGEPAQADGVTREATLGEPDDPPAAPAEQ